MLRFAQNPVLTAQNLVGIVDLEAGEVGWIIVNDDRKRRTAPGGVVGSDLGREFAVQAQVREDGLRGLLEKAFAFPGPESHPYLAQQRILRTEGGPPFFAQAQMINRPSLGGQSGTCATVFAEDRHAPAFRGEPLQVAQNNDRTSGALVRRLAEINNVGDGHSFKSRVGWAFSDLPGIPVVRFSKKTFRQERICIRK